MPYCSRCGVEVDNHVENCPLCNTPIQHFEEGAAAESRYPSDTAESKPRMTDRVRRRILWEVLTLLYAIAVIVVVGSDLRVDAAMDWSLYPTISIVLVWIYTTLLIFFRHHPVTIITGVIISTIAYLAAIDLVDGTLDWFFPLGLPIFAFFVTIAGILSGIAVRAKERGLNVVAFVLIGIAVFCLGVDLLVSHYLTGGVHFSWSIVVLLTLVPVSIILLFLHYRLRNRFDLKRIFHF